MPVIKFFGTRGSAPLSGEDYLEYGEATSCILLKYDDLMVMVDCGSGAGRAVEELKDVSELHLFITHSHLDHISGFVSLVSAFSGKKIHVYGKDYGGISLKDNLRRLMSYPLWPVSFSDENVIFHGLSKTVKIKDVKVSHMESNHPGGCTLYRFEDEESSVVTAFDFNHKDGFDEKLAEFAKDSSVMIYDGMFTDEEYKFKSDWGHSTPSMGAKIARKAGVKELYITHFGNYTDDELSIQEEKLRRKNPFLRFAKCGMHKNKFDKMIDVSTQLTSERDSNRILEDIIRAAMDISGADGGTLYLLKGDHLYFRVMITKSKNFFRGLNGEEIKLPPVGLSIENVCAASVIERKTINIPDVYHSEEYDFSGPRNYDKLNHYKTTSALVVPMTNDYGEIIGVIQLINATDEVGNVVAFSKEDVRIIEALASQAAISITNVNYSKQVSDLLFGFVRVISTGIDERTPYNANHTKNMVKYADRFFDFQNACKGPYSVNDTERREILISIWLHDIGKLITPLEIMNKNTRLGDEGLEKLEFRFEKIGLLLRLAHAEGRMKKKEYEKVFASLNEDLEFIRRINNSGFLPDEDFKRIQEISLKEYEDTDGKKYPYIDKTETDRLSIKKGTLTAEERKIMEDHVVMTSRMLLGLDFPRGFEHVPFYAGAHHEHLNGDGYPNHLTDKDLPWQVRLITIIDVFEALTAKDRPYKKPMPAEKALAILDDMAADNQIDSDILNSFKASKAWEEGQTA